jgi:four helix bundle protein
MGDFKELKVWQRSRELAKLTYSAAKALPRHEQDLLGAQMRTAVVSIAANIAEGSGRQSDRDQARCYRIALGSARELESLVIVADDLEMLRTGDRAALLAPIEEVEKMLNALIRYCVRHEACNRHRRSTRDPRPETED